MLIDGIGVVMVKKSLGVLLVAFSALVVTAPVSSAEDLVHRGKFANYAAAEGFCVMGKWAGAFESCTYVKYRPSSEVIDLFTNR
ncbi:hypothetical protein [Amycolatopsis oliviviridis]|nr:hypothetical protein [Amycolatopsis oliviviridis]